MALGLIFLTEFAKSPVKKPVSTFGNLLLRDKKPLSLTSNFAELCPYKTITLSKIFSAFFSISSWPSCHGLKLPG